jgi:3-hydroxyacyl-[acyl-carrier-protein] dehydratase
MSFVMVDRVLEMNPGKSIVASKTMEESEAVFQDHFPGFPVIPGVLLTEMMAQAGGRCLYEEDSERGFPVLVRIKDATFRSWARPGQEIRLFGEVVTSAATYASVLCRAEVGGKKICKADLSFSFLPADTLPTVPDIFHLEVQDHGE